MAATLKDEFSGDSLLELVEFRKATNKFFRENLQKKKNSISTKHLNLESSKFLPKKGFQFNLFQVALTDTAVSE